MTPEEQQYYDSLMGNKAVDAATKEHTAAPQVDYKEYAKSLGVPVDEIQKQITDETQASQPKLQAPAASGGSAIGNDVQGMVKGAAQGVADIAQNVTNFGIDIADKVENFASSMGVGTGELITNADHVDWATKLGSPNDSIVTRATRNITKYAAPVVATMGAGGGILAGLGVGAAADILTLDPHQERLSTLLRDEVPELKNYPVAYAAASALANTPGEGEFEGRFKNAVEGLGIGAPVAGIFTGIAKGFAAMRGTGKVVAGALEAGATKEQAMAKAAQNLATETELATSEAKLGSNADAQGMAINQTIEPVQGDLYNYAAIKDTPQGPKVNLNNTNVVDFAAQFAQQNPKAETDIFRASKGFEELDAEAKSVITDQGKLEALLGWKLGDRPLSDAEVKAGQYIMSNTYDNVVEAAIKASTTGAPEDLLHMSNMVDTFKYIDNARKGAGSEAGRALNAHKLSADLQNTTIEAFNAKLSAQGRQELLTNALMASGGVNDLKDLANTIRAISELPGDKVAKALADTPQIGGFKKFTNALNSVAINGMLSSPKTVVANFISNAMTSTTSVLTNYAATGIGFARGTVGGIQLADANAHIRGMFAGMFEGFGAAGQALRTGTGGVANTVKGDLAMPMSAISAEAFGIPIEQNMAYNMIGKVADATGLAVGLPSRINATADAFWGTVLYRGHVYEEASAAARAAGLSGQEATDFIQNRVANVSVDTHEAAKAYAQENTFSKALDPGSFGQAVDSLIEKVPMGRVVMPFFKTSANIIEYGFMHSPLAALSTPIRQQIIKGGVEGDKALARVMVGSTMLGAAAYMASEGIVTGPETRNFQMKSALEESGLGWQPDSIKIGDTYVNVQRIDPFSSIMRLGAVMSQLRNAIDSDEYDSLASVAGGAVADFMTPEMMVDGYSRLFEAYNEAARYDSKDKTASVFADVASRYIPFSALSRDVKNLKDPYKGSTAIVTQDAGFLDTFTQKVINRYKSISPWFSEDLPIQRNIFGEGLVVPDGLGPDMISSFATTKKGNSEVVQKLQQLAGFKESVAGNSDLPELNISMPPRNWSPVGGTAASIELTPKEYEKLVMYSAGLNPENGEKLGGPSLRDSMTEVLNGFKGTPQDLSPVEYEKMIGKISGVMLKYRQLGQKMMTQDPAIMGRWQKAFDASLTKTQVNAFQ